MKYDHDKEDIFEAIGFTDEEAKEATKIVNQAMDECGGDSPEVGVSHLVEALEKLTQEKPILVRYFIYIALRTNRLLKDSVPRHIVEKILVAKEESGLENIEKAIIVGPNDSKEEIIEKMKDQLGELPCETCENKEERDLSLQIGEECNKTRH